MIKHTISFDIESDSIMNQFSLLKEVNSNFDVYVVLDKKFHKPLRKKVFRKKNRTRNRIEKKYGGPLKMIAENVQVSIHYASPCIRIDDRDSYTGTVSWSKKK